MRPTRRSFLQYAGLAPAVAVAGAAGAAAPAHTGPAILTRSAFAACVGDEFIFQCDVFEQAHARLVVVDDLGARSPVTNPERQFRLVFEMQGPSRLRDASYRVTHAKLGELAMLVSPNDANGRRVEAIFNSP